MSGVRAYSDYRAFLNAHADAQKAARPSFSLSGWAKKLGLKSTSSLTKVLQGEREPGPRLVEALLEYFAFDERDAQYFRDLVRLSKVSHDPEHASLVMSRIDREADKKTRLMHDASFRFVSTWYCLPIRELLRADGSLSAKQLAKRLLHGVTENDAEQAIATMLTLGLLARDTRKGVLKVVDESVDTPADVPSQAVKRYHEQMIDHAYKSVRTVDVLERGLAGECFLMRKEDLPRAKEMIREFRRKFVSLFEKVAEGDEVYQLQIQLFPLTKGSLK